MTNDQILKQLENNTGSITITRFSDPQAVGISFDESKSTGYFNKAEVTKPIDFKITKNKVSLFKKIINLIKNKL